MGGLLDQIAVSVGERVGIHDDDAVLPFFFENGKVFAVCRDAVLTDFHEDGLWRACDLRKADALENELVLGLSEKSYRFMAVANRDVDEMRNEFEPHLVLAKLVANGDAFDDVAFQSAAAEQLVFSELEHAGIVVKVIRPQPVGFEHRVYLRLAGFQQKRNLAYFVFLIHSCQRVF